MLAPGTDFYMGFPGLPIRQAFLADLKQHLTKLTLATFGDERGRVQHLEALNMLPALQKLSLDGHGRHSPYHKADGRLDTPYSSLSEERLALKLPHLVSLQLCGLKKGAIALSCPKLSKFSMVDIESIQVKIKDAALESLVLSKCHSIHFAWESPHTQLRSVKKLSVKDCIEKGRHLMQDVGQMINLQKLTYLDFLVFFQDSAGCMPPTFPQNLQEIDLHMYDWCCDLPKGLKGLHELRKFCFTSMCRPWTFTVPLAKFLPSDNLETVSVGCERYRRSDEEKWRLLEESVLTDYV